MTGKGKKKRKMNRLLLVEKSIDKYYNFANEIKT